MSPSKLRISRFDPPRIPENIPVAGVSLRELLSERVTMNDVIKAFPGCEAAVADIIRTDDDVWRFRTPVWTWANMAGLEGFVVVRDGYALCWIVTRMN